MIYEILDTSKVAKLFDGWEETLIWSCLQRVMGHIFANDLENPTSAMAIIGDFCFFAGEPMKELVEFKPECCKQGFIIMTPGAKGWGGLIELVYRDKATKTTRYAIKKEQDIFDRDKLQNIVNEASESLDVYEIDSDIFQLTRTEGWMRDLTSQYDSYEDYVSKGALGVVVMKDGDIVSGASAYTAYNDGIEIEIDTREDCRRNGYALLCAAKLILNCIDQGKYPSWDAQNPGSVALAEKLGYHFSHEYTVYEICGY